MWGQNENTKSCFGCELKDHLFHYLTRDELALIDKNKQTVVFKNGETIFKSGGPLTHIICIIRGMAKVYLENDEIPQKRILLDIVKPVQIIGGPGFLIDDKHYTTVTALENAAVCFIKTEYFLQAMRSNPEFSMQIIKHINRRTIFYFEKLYNFTYKNAHGKIANTLLYLSDKIYKNKSFECFLNRQDIADMSGMTKESAVRILKEFEREKLIVCQTNRFDILNMEALEKISRFG